MQKLYENSLSALWREKDFICQNLENSYKLPLAFLLGNRKNWANETELILFQNYSSNNFFKRINDRRCVDYYNYWLYLYYFFEKSSKKDLIYKSILQSKHPENGGFIHTPGINRAEIRATAFSGICAYLQKDYETHFSCSSFLIDLYEKNRKNENFYMVMPFEDIQDFPYDRLNIFDLALNNPLYYALSLAIINLCLSYLVCKDRKYCDYAEKYAWVLDLSRNETLQNSYSAKLCVALSLLYKITGKIIYQMLLIAVKNYLCSGQQDDGFWYLDGHKSYDRTAEFTALLLLSEKIMEEDYVPTISA